MPARPGLGVELDPHQVERAHALYNTLKHGERDDVSAMRCLIPDWTFDPKRPCLVR